MRKGRRAAATTIVALLMTGCQSGGAPEPALLVSADVKNTEVLKDVLAAALGRASVDFDDAALTTASTIAVRPPAPGPYETRSLATPELFDIVLIRTECFVIRRSTGETFDLPGVPCRPARQAK